MKNIKAPFVILLLCVGLFWELGLLAADAPHFVSRFTAPEGWTRASDSTSLPLVFTKKGKWVEALAWTEIMDASQAPKVPQSEAELKTHLEKSVNSAARYFGSRDYRVDSIQKLSLPTGTLFKVKGSYFGAIQKKVQFEEWKYYLKRGFAQVTFSIEGKEEFPEASYVDALLKRFQPLGESF